MKFFLHVPKQVAVVGEGGGAVAADVTEDRLAIRVPNAPGGAWSALVGMRVHSLHANAFRGASDWVCASWAGHARPKRARCERMERARC